MRQFRYSILIILSLFCTLIIVCPASVRGIISFGSCGVILFILLLRYRGSVYQWRNNSRKRISVSLLLISIAIAVGFLDQFTSVWLPSSKLRVVSSSLHIPHHVLVYAIGIIAAIGTIVFIHEFLSFSLNPKFDSGRSSFLNGSQESITAESARGTESWQEKGFILLCAVAAVTLCSCSSPLYPMNGWGDITAYFTVGKGMFRGLVPYRDLFDHKGPYLFLLYGLASLISSDSLIGGYLLEIITAYVYLLYSYRIACLHMKKGTILIVPLIALITFTSTAFVQGGCPEELCLAFTAYSLWLFLRDYLNHDLRSLHFLSLGIIAGCIFWTKFTLIGVYIGWYLWMFLNMICDKQGKALASRTLMLFCGVVLATVPWFLYFSVHGAIKDWFEVYLYDNIFAYSFLPRYSKTFFMISAIRSLGTGLATAFTNNPITMVLSVFFTANTLRERHDRLAALYAFTILGTIIAIFIGGRAYPYYSLPMAVFLAPSLALVLACTSQRRHEQFQNRLPILVILCFLGMFMFTPNQSFMWVKKEDLAQYQFRKIITENSSEATLLNYGALDGGFYTVCDILPNCRAFHIPAVLVKELMAEQNTYVNSGLCDYVVTCTEANSSSNRSVSSTGNSSESSYTTWLENRFDLYNLIAECTSPANGRNYTFHLYQLKSLTE